MQRLIDKIGEFYFNGFCKINEYYKNQGWSLSSLRSQIERFAQNNVKDNLLDRSIKLHILGHNRQSKIYFTTQYGDELGELKFKKLQERQAYTNSKEYKNMTDDEFREYNKNRACTKNNFIKRHGEEKGLEKWNNYVKNQSYTKSSQYYIDKFGEEKGLKIFSQICKSKAITLNKFINKYGIEEGFEKYINLISKRTNYYSKIASNLFDKIDSAIKNLNLNIFYAPKCTEYHIIHNGKTYFYDFVIPELKYCIEFNGDTFHANPKFFKSSDKPNPFINHTALEIWENDKIKYNILKSKGFSIDFVWESDYKADKDKILNDLISNIRFKYQKI